MSDGLTKLIAQSLTTITDRYGMFIMLRVSDLTPCNVAFRTNLSQIHITNTFNVITWTLDTSI